MQLWSAIAQLEGETLTTLDRKNAFDVVAVGQHGVAVRPHIRNITRTIRRDEIEGAYNELVSSGAISRTDIHARHSEFNPAYVAAILAAIPGVTASTKPIQLHYRGCINKISHIGELPNLRNMRRIEAS